MFRKKSKPLRVDRSMLPTNFAQQVLDLQTQVDFRPTVSSITTLMQLYSVIYTQRAIEFYESVKDPKYLHYQERLQNILSKKDVIKALQTGQSTPQSVQTKRRAMDHRQRRRAQNISEGGDRPLLRNADPETTINSYISDSSKTASKVRDNLKSQEDVSHRLEARKRALSHQPSKKQKNIVKYQTEIERVMESYVEEKLRRVTEIKIKYRLEMDQVKYQMEGEMLDQMIDRLDGQMKGEIDQVTGEVNLRRREHLDSLKIKLIQCNSATWLFDQYLDVLD